MITFDLNKSAETIKFSLEKAGVNTPPAMDVAVVMDVSGSFEDEHLDGLTQTILTRFIPWSMVFDPDKKIDLFTFSNGFGGVDYAGEVTLSNYMDYMKQYVIGKVSGWCGGTDYRFVLQSCREHFGWVMPKTEEKSGGFFNGLFGKKKPAAATSTATPSNPRKSLILFVTDGDNSYDDEAPTERLLQEMQNNGEEVYVMFFGVSNQRPSFKFLKHIADRFANTGLHIQYNVAEFANMSDDDLCGAIITDELVAWIKK